MKKSMHISISLFFLMAFSSVLTTFITPELQLASSNKKLNLESMIPRKFSGWKIDPLSNILMVNPDSDGLLTKIYAQTLSRIYINNENERVMLSIAYGNDQTTDLHVHRPEICYAADGFDMGKMSNTYIDTCIGRIPVIQINAKKVDRNELITYWIRIGDSLTQGWIEQKLTAISYGLTGKLPDGLVFRVSTISNEEQDSYRIQQNFISALMLAVRNEDRYWLIGKSST